MQQRDHSPPPVILPHPWFRVSWGHLGAIEWQRVQDAIIIQRPNDSFESIRWLQDELTEYDDRTIWQLCYRVYENCDDVAARLAWRLERVRNENTTRNVYDFLSDEGSEGPLSAASQTSDESLHGEQSDQTTSPEECLAHWGTHRLGVDREVRQQ